MAWRTAVALGTDCDIQPFSVDKMLRMAARGKLQIDSDTVLVVDEAGMLSVRQAHHILDLARDCGAKVVFAGDTQQQQAIEAGPGIRLARDIAGSVRVDQIRRQRATLEEVLEHTQGLDRGTARLQAGLTGAEERERILEAFESLPDEPDWTPWQITASEAFRDCKAGEAIAAYEEHGRFHLCRDLDATLTRLVDHWAAYQQANPLKSTVVLGRTNAEVRALSQLMRERNLAGRATEEQVRVDVCRGREGDRKISPIEIARGDRLRIGATCWNKQLFNGTIVIVDQVEVLPGRKDEKPAVLISGRTEHGRKVSFRHDEIKDYYGNVRIDYGYALTIASAQGLTVDQAFLLADEKPARETIYPACTRHREGLDIYVDRNPLALDIRAQRSEDKADEEVTDKEIKEYLAKRWSRKQPKEAARDFMSTAMRKDLEREERDARRSTDPDRRDAASWLVANDNGDGRLRRVATAVRYAALDLRHGEAVDVFARERDEIVAAYDQFRDQIRTDGSVVALQPAFRETLDRHAELLGGAERWRSDSRFGALLRRRAGIGPGELNAFEQLLASASQYRRQAFADHGRVADNDARAEDVGASVEPSPAPRPGQEAFEAFLRDWDAFTGRASLTGHHPFYAEGYPEMYRRMQEISARTDLPDDVRQYMEDTLGGHDQLVARRTEVRDWLKAAERLGDRRGALEGAARGTGSGLIEAEDYLAWGAEAEQLVSAGQRMLADPDTYGPHLEEARLGDDTVNSALEKIETFLETDRASVEGRTAGGVSAGVAPPSPAPRPGQEAFEAFLRDWDAFTGRASLTGHHPFYAEGYPEMYRRMQEISARTDLPDDVRQYMEDTLGGHDQLVARRTEVRDWLKAAERLGDRRGALEGAARGTGSGLIEAEDYLAWGAEAEQLVSAGQRMLADPDTYGPHLKEARLGDDTVNSALEKIVAGLDAADNSVGQKEPGETDYSWEKARKEIDLDTGKPPVSGKRDRGSRWSL